MWGTWLCSWGSLSSCICGSYSPPTWTNRGHFFEHVFSRSSSLTFYIPSTCELGYPTLPPSHEASTMRPPHFADLCLVSLPFVLPQCPSCCGAPPAKSSALMLPFSIVTLACFAPNIFYFFTEMPTCPPIMSTFKYLTIFIIFVLQPLPLSSAHNHEY